MVIQKYTHFQVWNSGGSLKEAVAGGGVVAAQVSTRASVIVGITFVH